MYAWLGTDAEKPAELRKVHFSDDLPEDFFQGITSEVYDPKKNRFDKRYKRNEPLDTWVYGYVAAHHPELRLHRLSKSDWDEREKELLSARGTSTKDRQVIELPDTRVVLTPPPTPEIDPGVASSAWSRRL